jgi:hypothetical protein
MYLFSFHVCLRLILVGILVPDHPVITESIYQFVELVKITRFEQSLTAAEMKSANQLRLAIITSINNLKYPSLGYHLDLAFSIAI